MTKFIDEFRKQCADCKFADRNALKHGKENYCTYPGYVNVNIDGECLVKRKVIPND